MIRPEKGVVNIMPVNPLPDKTYSYELSIRRQREENVRKQIRMVPGYEVIRNPAAPGLHLKCKKIKNVQDSNVHDLAKTLVGHTLIERAWGLAANQIGWNARCCTIVLPDEWGRPSDNIVVLFNPRIVACPDFTEENITWGVRGNYFEEGCLSHPGIYGEVCRLRKFSFIASTLTQPKEQTYNTWDLGNSVQQELFARVCQHEFDHLNGVLFTDKGIHLRNLRTDPFGQEILMSENRKAAEFGLPEVEE